MVDHLQGKKIVLGISGSIAAYKGLDLIRRLRERGATARVVLTEGATAFITPLSAQALSDHPVHQDLLNPTEEASMTHIALARWADLILIAPATAHGIAKLAHGLADDLLTTLCLATKAPIAVAPAMNQQMWENSITQQNVATLKKHGFLLWGPDQGSQACGEVGAGRMLEPLALVNKLQRYFSEASAPLFSKASNLRESESSRFDFSKSASKIPTSPSPTLPPRARIVITAGPTQEPLDPVRYLSNHSSGKMGYALAEAAKAAGHSVLLISGPTSLTPPAGIRVVSVQTADEMLKVVLNHLESTDIFIGCAAVADYTPLAPRSQKIKKNEDLIHLKLKKTPDIIQQVAAHPNRPYTVGFAAETECILENAHSKLNQKKLDLIIANDVSNRQVFGHSQNEVIVLAPQNEALHFPKQDKIQLSEKLIETIVSRWYSKICSQQAETLPS